MKGYPPVEALVLLFLLLITGLASQRFIHHEPEPLRPVTENPKVESSDSGEEIEMELSFSSQPNRIRLLVLTEGDAEPQELALVEGEDITNPCYLDLMLTLHSPMTYWLDISWAEPPGENALHMAKVTLTTSDASPVSHTFTCGESDMNETFTFPFSVQP